MARRGEIWMANLSRDYAVEQEGTEVTEARKRAELSHF